MKIKVGEYDVLKDGCIVGNTNEPIDFIIVESTGFIIRILFKDDDNISEAKIVSKKFNLKGGELTFNNFNSSLGIGNTTPILIGHFNKRKLYLNYRVHALEKAAKTFHYTWLLGKEIDNV